MKGGDSDHFLFDHTVPLRCPIALTDTSFNFPGKSFRGPIVSANKPAMRPQPYTSTLKDFRDLLHRVVVDPTGYS